MRERIIEKIEYLNEDIYATEKQIEGLREKGMSTFFLEESVKSMQREISVLIWLLNEEKKPLWK